MTNETTKRYAAYDDDAVYGIGDTPQEAITDAQKGCNEEAEAFETAEISDALFAWIKEHGWDGKHEAFEVHNGQLFRTTDREFTVGARVQGGAGEDHDVGKVVDYLDPPLGQCDVRVAWQSGQITPACSGTLWWAEDEPYQRASNDPF